MHTARSIFRCIDPNKIHTPKPSLLSIFHVGLRSILPCLILIVVLVCVAPIIMWKWIPCAAYVPPVCLSVLHAIAGGGGGGGGAAAPASASLALTCLARLLPFPPRYSMPQMVGVYVSAGWCPPCRVFSPMLSKWAKERKDEVAVVLVSLDKRYY